MSDQSFLDDQYFVDDSVYNCPFCNRRHVMYSVYGITSFDWTHDRTCFAYFVRCHSCKKQSMHLSNHKIWYREPYKSEIRPNLGIIEEFNTLDDAFFYSAPTSFFVLDQRIPRKLRELLTEAEGSLKGNFLTGASACARKIVYELAALQNTTDGSYEERIKSLKGKLPEVDGTYFDTLLTIQKATSSKVHENAYDGWEGKHVRLILSALREILHEVYVVPALRSDRRKGILELQKEVLGDSRDLASDNTAADNT